MKTIRIGCGSGGCTYERMEPTIELLEKGALDYLVFECLAERTIALAQKEKRKDPAKGYNPMLEDRMRAVMPLAVEKGVKIVSNMGAANTPAAVAAIVAIGRELGLAGLKVAMVQGDDILANLHTLYDTPLLESELPLRSLDGAIVSANVYLNGEPVREALSMGADIVITGRVADPSLFVGPLRYEFGWDASVPDFLGQAILLGHMMECAAQLTGGYYADPGYKDVLDLHLLGQPIATIDERGGILFTKVEGSGGMVCVDICKEQLLYEIGDPSRYITPDGIADFSRVTFKPDGKDRVKATGATIQGLPESYKANIGYQNCFVGEAEISFGGANSLSRARLAADIVTKRLEMTGAMPEELRIDYIGYNSLYRDTIGAALCPHPPGEVRLRIAGRSPDKAGAVKVVREVECLYINGPAGSSGIRSTVDDVVAVENIFLPISAVSPRVTLFEV
ncbi:DUF1446 domain-containing protein [Desulfovibrio sp. OttesenSCG-928-G15]|nr:DUF1446 domain-containing protein [Desulfovibrio sp. OttesenSCG-928-G15]